MYVQYFVRAVDRKLHATMKSPNVHFGGNCILFSRDFRQIETVVPRGSRRMIAFLSLQPSPLFAHLLVLKLSENMRMKSMEHDKNTDNDFYSSLTIYYD